MTVRAKSTHAVSDIEGDCAGVGGGLGSGIEEGEAVAVAGTLAA
jgi:hypothetical protein